MSPKYKWILLDGRHLMWRVTMKLALSAELPGGDRVPTGGIWGFINVATKVVEDWGDREGCTLVVCWEGCGGPRGYGHRTDLYPDYKGNRSGGSDLPDDVRAYLETMDDQQRLLKGMLQRAGWNQAWAPDFEGDDILSTIAHKLQAAGETAIMIYTADHDLHQMVNEHITVVAPPSTSGKERREKVYDTKAVCEKHGVPPELVADLKGLGGDAGDNIPGVPGVGPGWAAKMLNAYGCLEEVVLTAESGETLTGEADGKKWSSPAKTVAVREHAALARICLQLATTRRDAPVRFIPRAVDHKKLVEAFQRFKMRTLLMPNTLDTIKDIGARPFPSAILDTHS